MELTFDDFKNRAKDKSLSKWEKIGFPDSYRKDSEQLIFEDISDKCNIEQEDVKTILDIGCGCGDLVTHFISNAIQLDKKLYLIDSKEMLDNIEINHNNIIKIDGYFPNVNSLADKNIFFDVIVVYSVIQYPFLEQSIYSFIHRCIQLLKVGGRLLIGDIPNSSARNRFLNSDEGLEFKTTIKNTNDKMQFNHDETERIDDSIVLSILARYRNYGCETYLLPQKSGLPFANRREDILIIKR
jgi:2-polyprenyl-3-methyl-5-hydroxy-6-metoxy-1,4-benzoquinol methylase